MYVPLKFIFVHRTKFNLLCICTAINIRLMLACDRIGQSAQLNTHVISFWLDNECSFLKTTPYCSYKQEFYANYMYVATVAFVGVSLEHGRSSDTHMIIGHHL